MPKAKSDFTNFIDARPNYFPGQFLLEDDFEIEQKYFIDRQKYHRQSLYVSGIIEGLEVQVIQGKTEVLVKSGSGINSNGDLIILKKDTFFSQFTTLTVGELYISYREEKQVKQQEDFTRWQEVPTIGFAATTPNDGVKLAKISIVNNVPSLDLTVRSYSGIFLPNATGNDLTLRSGGNANPNVAILDGSLTVTGTITGKIDATSINSGVLDIARIPDLSVLGYESTISDFCVPLKSGFYQNGGVQTVTGNIPDLSHAWTHLIVARHSNTTNNCQLQIASSYTENDRLFFRKLLGGDLSPDNSTWNEVATKVNGKLSGTLDAGNIDSGTLNAARIANNSLSSDKIISLSANKITSGTISGNLSVTGALNADSLVLGPTNSSHLRLGYHQDYSWIQSHGNKPLLINTSNNVGIGSTVNPIASLDISSASRTGTHPTAVKGLYVTGDFNADSDGVEFRHSNGSQGIGFGFNTIYAAGSGANQGLSLKPKGTGEVTVSGNLKVTGTLTIPGSSDTNLLQVGAELGSKAGIQLSGHLQLLEYGTNNLAYLQARNDSSNRNIGLRIRTQKQGTSSRELVDALTISPAGDLSVQGVIQSKGYKIQSFEMGGKTSAAVTPSASNTTMVLFPDLTRTFTLTTATLVFAYYSIAMPGGGSHLVVQLVVDGTIQGSTIVGNTEYWGISDLWFGELSAGEHTIEVRYRTPKGGTCTPSVDWQNRVLRILVFSA